MPVVLFVCTGNTCRSPMAAALLRARWQGRGVEVLSAGTAAAPGYPAAPEAVAAAAALGADLGAHRSRHVDGALMIRADVVVALTREHAGWLRGQFPAQAHKVVTLGEAAYGPGGPDVDDPIGADVQQYRRTATQIQELLAAAEPELLRRLELRSH